jgi:hypothetical protein
MVIPTLCLPLLSSAHLFAQSCQAKLPSLQRLTQRRHASPPSQPSSPDFSNHAIRMLRKQARDQWRYGMRPCLWLGYSSPAYMDGSDVLVLCCL